MSATDLPAELWTHIFDLAADEDVIFQYGLPTVMAEAAWFKNVFGDWTLRKPEEALNLIQRRSYATKKAIISTCKSWRRLGSEILFRCLHFDTPSKLHSLCTILDTSLLSSSAATSSPGWWTKRIHLTSYYGFRSSDSTISDTGDLLVSIIRHCPNLEILIVECHMGSSFGCVADSLTTYVSKSLRTIHWKVSQETLPKVIWALDSLPFLLSAYIEFEPPPFDEQDDLHLGAASNVHLTLPGLQQLSLKGYFQEFLEQATGWSIPSLRSLSFDCGNTRTDQPDVIAFLIHHGAELEFLDLYCIPPLDVPKILDLCPLLTTFNFNADWRFPSSEAEPTDPSNSVPSGTIVHRPHANITSIGLHGLMYAFGVGYAATFSSIEPLRSVIIRRTNDLNVSTLTKLNFPKLERVRALNQTVLMDLNKENGPGTADGGWERWERWWAMCVGNGVRLEDCTGALLGTLPPVDEEEEEEDEEDEEESDEEVFEIEIPPMPREEGDRVSELRQLLEECRVMAEQREESMFGSMGSFFGVIEP